PDRAKTLRIAREHVADEQSAVAAAVAGEPLRARDPPSNEIGRHGGEVIVRALLALADTGFMPGGAELAAAANVGDHIDAAAPEPGLAHAHGIGRDERDEKPAVAVEDCGRAAIKSKVLRPDLEIGDVHAIVGD